ncbi:MAG: endonuclease [Nitrospinales bacterium]
MPRDWNQADPPSEWEKERNGIIEGIQGNRNPFVDNPVLVENASDF